MAEVKIDVLGEEVYEIEMEEAIPLVISEGDAANHALLTNREAPSQHPITAIEGLREELNDIWALKESFSNKYGHANYYLWSDGGGEISERVGYFVSACDGDCSKIAVCNGGPVLGVSVDTAGFIGNRADAVQTVCNVCGNVVDEHRIACSNTECQSQDVGYVRRIEYGLVASSGIVPVRCENDVARGDYVMPNFMGIAKKINNAYGYRVIEIDNILGVPYATIDLDSSTSLVHGLGVKVDRVESRVRTNEQNIVSTVNVANQAYNKAQESTTVSTEAIRQALEAIGKAEGAETTVNGMNETLNSVRARSEQARAIAQSAVSSANAIRDEAIVVVNNAVKDTTDLKNQFLDMEQQITDIEGEVTLATKYISSEYIIVSDDPGAGNREQTKIYYNATELKYYEYKDGNWQDKDTFDTLETVIIEVIYYVASTKLYWYYQDNIWKDTDKAYNAGLLTAVSGLQVKTDENGASINSLVSWQDTAKSSMARIEQKADANGAHIQSTVFNIDKYSVGSYSQAYGFTLEQAAVSFEGEIIYVPTESHEEEYAYATEGTKCDEWSEDEKDKRLVYYVVATSDDNTETKTYYYWGYSETNAAYEWLTSNSIPTYERSFIPGYLYKWGRLNGDGPYRWITVDKDYSPLDTENDSTMSVYFQANNAPVINEGDTYGYWYTDGDELTGTAEGYELYTLYKWDSYTSKDEDGNDITQYHWVAVATLAGNTQNRIASMIRQDANRIEMSVTDVKGDVASVRASISDTDATVQMVASWKSQVQDDVSNIATIKSTADAAGASVSQVVEAVGKDGEVNAASIVTAVTEDESAISLLADCINLDADQINFTAGDFTIDANHINFTGDEFTISIGGVNLISKSDLGDTVVKIENNSKSGFGFMCEGGKTNVTVFGQTGDLNLKTNTDYTVSFVAWIETADSSEIQVINCDLFPDTLPEFLPQVTSTPTRFSCIMRSEHSDMGNASLRFFSNQQDASGTYYVKNKIYITDIKLEDGNRATDWSPASEDVVRTDNIVTCINASKEGVTIQGDKIDITGNLSYQSFTETTTAKFDNYSTTLAMNSAIEAKFDTINLGVYALKDDVDGTVKELESKLALGIETDDKGNTYAYLNGSADTIKFDATKTIEINATNFELDSEGNIAARRGTIGNWDIDTDSISKGDVLIYSGDERQGNSLVSPGFQSPVRIAAGMHKYFVTTLTKTSDLAAGDNTISVNRDRWGELVSVEVVQAYAAASWDSSITYDVTCSLVDVNTSDNEFTVNLTPPSNYDSNSMYLCIKYAFVYRNQTSDYSFKVLEDGSLYAGAVKLGSGMLGSNNSIFLNTTDMAGVDGFFYGTSINNWRLTVGSNFGVTSDGILFARNVSLTGNINSASDTDASQTLISSGHIYLTRPEPSGTTFHSSDYKFMTVYFGSMEYSLYIDSDGIVKAESLLVVG